MEDTPGEACAVLHTDREGNAVPCPGHPHPEGKAADPLSEARRLLADDEQARMQACATDLEQVLARHGMRLDVTPATITIVPM